MELSEFLSDHDAERARRTLARLQLGPTSPLVLTGGFAIEMHLLRGGFATEPRPLNDIDFLAESFEAIPASAFVGMIFRHVHPHDPPGKTLLQSVDPETAVRVDVFRACGNTIARAVPITIEGRELRVVSAEDLAARAARLCMDLACGTPIPAKHARDFQRLLPLLKTNAVNAIWPEHRKPNHPASFAETVTLLTDLIAAMRDLQTAHNYSSDTKQACSRCEATDVFPLAGAEQVFSLLGYC
jgi:hypothetical protein